MWSADHPVFLVSRSSLNSNKCYGLIKNLKLYNVIFQSKEIKTEMYCCSVKENVTSSINELLLNTFLLQYNGIIAILFLFILIIGLLLLYSPI